MFCFLKTRRPSEIRTFESVQTSSVSHRTRRRLVSLFLTSLPTFLLPQLLKSEHFQLVSANMKLNVFLGFVRLSLAVNAPTQEIKK